MQHLACIMDGNRRWAKKNSLQSFRGHRMGAEAIQRVVAFCLHHKIRYLSLYTFSLENFNRSIEERSYFFNLIKSKGPKQLDEFLKNKVRVRFIGDRKMFPSQTVSAIEYLEENTKHCTALDLNFLFCYGARQEIVSGIKQLIGEIKKGVISEEEITEKNFYNYLWTAQIPEPDLIIRTGGAFRLSNFLLYQAAYSELYFTECLWPEISEKNLQDALDFFYTTKRNFGS